MEKIKEIFREKNNYENSNNQKNSYIFCNDNLNFSFKNEYNNDTTNSRYSSNENYKRSYSIDTYDNKLKNYNVNNSSIIKKDDKKDNKSNKNLKLSIGKIMSISYNNFYSRINNSPTLEAISNNRQMSINNIFLNIQSTNDKIKISYKFEDKPKNKKGEEEKELFDKMMISINNKFQDEKSKKILNDFNEKEK